ncbi:MAG: hypothetical protein HZA50_01695 [Planctomycetes bacterium]|nr:hypothetical protein [Planctomycetota bacterium]
MQFFKENKFLIGVVAGTILLSCVFLILASGTAESVANSLVDRDKAENLLKECENEKDPPNHKSVDINKGFVTGINTQKNESKQITIDWNRKRYADQIIELTHTELGKVKAFPPDIPKFRQYGLWLYFRKEYNRNREKLMKDIGRPAEEPTAADVEALMPYWKKVVEYNDRLNAPATPATVAPTPVTPTPVRPPVITVPPGGAAPAPAGPSVDERARQLARQTVRGRAAQSGDIYFSKEAVENLFPSLEDSSEIKLEDLKNAQIFLWVLNDIIEAISSTNKEALASPKAQELIKKSGHKPCVMYSAVKKVEKIEILFDRKSPNVLTGRATNAEQTMVGYRIRLIMPMSQLGLFQANLLKLNYHTLTSVQAEAFAVPADALYDYGLEPVWTFTIEGEILFKAAWERDLWKPVGTAPPVKPKNPP